MRVKKNNNWKSIKRRKGREFRWNDFLNNNYKFYLKLINNMSNTGLIIGTCIFPILGVIGYIIAHI